ncbi:uncharacterized protein LOC122512821 [Leptopilina heterotoma]|uniref:uncharacterized protein LOC122512821 n=1 Tax=Leptopilina heterotoma TaxID=63436 RepID=UPI001CA95A17|nr:uncharacterized protein LOC122512821 [Leptopilina heterotoma]
MKIQILAISILFASAKSIIIPNYENEQEAALGPVSFPPVISRPENAFQNIPNTANPVNKEISEFPTEENAFSGSYIIIDETHGIKYIVKPLNNLKIIVRKKPFLFSHLTPLRLLLGRFGYYHRSPPQFIHSY